MMNNTANLINVYWWTTVKENDFTIYGCTKKWGTDFSCPPVSFNKHVIFDTRRTIASLSYSSLWKIRTNWWEDGEVMERDRGVHVPHSANKQKVNTDCDTRCCPTVLHLPAQVSHQAILPGVGQKRCRSQHLSPPGAFGYNGGRKKQNTTFVCWD